MANAFAVPFAPTADPNTASRIFTFTAAEPGPVSVTQPLAAGGVVNSPPLVGKYIDGQTFSATVTSFNSAGVPQATPTLCTVTISIPVVAPVVPAPVAADAITGVTVVNV